MQRLHTPAPTPSGSHKSQLSNPLHQSFLLLDTRLRRQHALPGLSGVEPGVLRKARLLSAGVGGLAGAIGSLVGVGGGVIISPIIGSACK